MKQGSHFVAGGSTLKSARPNFMRYSTWYLLNKRWKRRLASTRALNLFQKNPPNRNTISKKHNFAIACIKFDVPWHCIMDYPSLARTVLQKHHELTQPVHCTIRILYRYERVRVKIVNQVYNHITTRSCVKKMHTFVFSLTPFCRTRFLAFGCVVKRFFLWGAVLHSWVRRLWDITFLFSIFFCSTSTGLAWTTMTPLKRDM